MPERLLLCLIVVLAAACGGPHDGTETTAAAAPEQSQATSAAGGGSTADLPPLSGPPRANRYLQVAVIAAGFDPAGRQAPSGLRYYGVGLRGIARSRSNDVLLEFRSFVFAQNEHGCISRPESDTSWLKHPFGATETFTATPPSEGQLAFLVPEDTQRVRVLFAPASEDGLVVPVGTQFEPAWPTPIQTIEDGSTLRVLVLPGPTLPATLPPAAAGRENVALDFVVENLKSTQGIEFTTSQQLRLALPDAKFVQASPLTKEIGCRLDDGDVIPAGHARRFIVVYDMPAGAARRLQYRGFEVEEVTVDLP